MPIKYGRRENIRKQNIIIAKKRKRRIIAYCSSILFIIINSVFFIFFTWTLFEKDYINFVPFGLIILDSILVAKILDGFIPFPNSIAFALLSFFVFLFILAFYHGQFKKNELKLYGKEMYGLITDKDWHKPARLSGYWAVTAEFKVENKLYRTFSIEDEDEIFEIGDTTQVIYSTRNPEISKLVELEE